MSAPAPAPAGAPVSAHGGHSRAFCSHARDTLEEIVSRYAELGFAWVGLTEHMPAVSDRFLYPEERSEGLDAAATRRRFDRFVERSRQLQREWSGRLELFVGMESEAVSGAIELARELQEHYRLDWMVGSVHHVDDLPIDTSERDWLRAAEQAGGVDELYLRYFDRQLEVVEGLEPAVVGHFDLVRLYDPDHSRRLETPPIRRRIERNLERIAELGLALDVNSRAFAKGQSEPFPGRAVLARALELGIELLPGDDAHAADDVGGGYDQTRALLTELGATGPWRAPTGC